ncbi:MAG: diacylglycerol/lipid kinase family protein [Calditrichia bacterium]
MLPLNRSFAFFVNPVSRDGYTFRQFQIAIKKIPVLLEASKIYQTSTVDNMLVELSSLPISTVAVAVGGDGTVNMLAQVILKEGKGRVMGVVPFGTGNAVAHQLGASSRKRAFEILISGQPLALDVMKTNHPDAPLALISFSCGFEATLLYHYARGRKTNRRIAGANAFLRTLGKANRHVVLKLDDESVLNEDNFFYNAGLYVIKKYAYGINMNIEAQLDDGLAEFLVHKTALSYWRDLLGAGAFGKPGKREPIQRWKNAIFHAPDGLQCDGESISGGTVELEVLPEALTFLEEKDDE